MPRVPFVWSEIEHWTGGDLIETLSLISTQTEADSFVEAYAALFSDDDEAVESLRYWLQLIGKDAEPVAELLGVEMPSKTETISPRQTFGNTSLGVFAA